MEAKLGLPAVERHEAEARSSSRRLLPGRRQQWCRARAGMESRELRAWWRPSRGRARRRQADDGDGDLAPSWAAGEAGEGQQRLGAMAWGSSGLGAMELAG